MVGAQGPPPLAPALHTDLQLVAKPRRTVVQGTHRQTAAAWNLRQHRRTHRGDHHLGRALEPRPQAIHLESHRRRHHRQGPTRTRHTPPKSNRRQTTRWYWTQGLSEVGSDDPWTASVQTPIVTLGDLAR